MKKRFIGLAALVTFVVVIVLTVAVGCGRKNDSYSYVKMDMGQLDSSNVSLDADEPTIYENELSQIKIHLVVNANNTVVAIDGLTNNSKGLLVDLSLNGKKLDEVIQIILNEAIALDLLTDVEVDGAKDSVKVSIYSNNESLQKKQKDKIAKFVNGWKAEHKIEVSVDNSVNVSVIQKIVKEYNPELSDDTVEKMSGKELLNQVKVNVSENSTFVDVDLQNSFINQKTLVKVDKDKVLVNVEASIKKDVEAYLELKNKLVDAQIKLQNKKDEKLTAIEDKYEEKRAKIDEQYQVYLQRRSELIKTLENNSSSEQAKANARNKYDMSKVEYYSAVKALETFKKIEMSTIDLSYSAALAAVSLAEKTLDAFFEALADDTAIKVRVSVDRGFVEVNVDAHSKFINNTDNKEKIENAKRKAIEKKRQIKVSVNA